MQEWMPDMNKEITNRKEKKKEKKKRGGGGERERETGGGGGGGGERGGTRNTKQTCGKKQMSRHKNSPWYRVFFMRMERL